jgi:hypothetical protein
MARKRIEPDTTGRDLVRMLAVEQQRKDRTDLTTPPKNALAIGEADDTGNALYLKAENLGLALHVVGASRSGKTNFLKRVIRQLLERKRRTGWGFAVLDPHGELAEFAVDLLALTAGDLASETYYVDFRQEPILSINPLARWWPADHPKRRDLEYSVADLWKEALTKAYGVRNSMNQPRIATVLTHLGEALVASGLAPSHASYFLNRGPREKAILGKLVSQLPSGDTRAFWDHYQSLRPAECDSYSEGPRNRLRPVTGYEQLRLMLGQPDHALDFLTLMNRGGIAIFNLSLRDTAVSPDAQQLVASLLLQQFRQAFPRRTENDIEKSPPFTLVLDEFGEYCAPEFAHAFTAARKYHFEVIFAHQDLDQLVPAENDQQLLNTVLAVPNKAVFGGLFIEQAELLAKQMYLAMLDPDKVQHQPQTVSFWPISVKDIAHAWSRSKGFGEGEGTSETSTASETSSLSEVLGPASGALGLSANEIARSIASSGVLSGSSSGRSRYFASSHAWSEAAHEIWRTEYRPFLQPGTPVFDDLSVQVFRYAQAMSLRPPGHFVFYQRPDVPLFAHVDLEKQPRLTDDAREAFLAAVYRNPEYRERAAVVASLAAMDRALGDDIDDQPIVIG